MPIVTILSADEKIGDISFIVYLKGEFGKVFSIWRRKADGLA